MIKWTSICTTEVQRKKNRETKGQRDYLKKNTFQTWRGKTGIQIRSSTVYNKDRSKEFSHSVTHFIQCHKLHTKSKKVSSIRLSEKFLVKNPFASQEALVCLNLPTPGGHKFNHWSRKIPRVSGTTKPMCHNYLSLQA